MAAVTPQSPQGLGPVVSGRNLGELCSLSSLGLVSCVGAPDGGKSHVVFKLSETKEIVLPVAHMARCHQGDPRPHGSGTTSLWAHTAKV